MVLTNVSEQQEPPIYAQRFETPAITPKKSYYWYFEADSPLEVKQVLFKEFYE